MDKIFLSGWACSQAIIPENIAEKVHFFDTTRIISSCINSTESNFEETLLSNLQQLCTSDSTIVSWSTGSLILLPLLHKLEFKEALIYAPALSFIRSEENPMGAKERFLDSMIENLNEHRELTMKKFFRNCALQDGHNYSDSYTSDELINGLKYLKQIQVKAPLIHDKATLYHGKSDKIIPFSAGEIASKESGLPLIALEGGHFQEQMFSHFS